jgi:hypothetical protein
MWPLKSTKGAREELLGLLCLLRLFAAIAEFSKLFGHPDVSTGSQLLFFEVTAVDFVRPGLRFCRRSLSFPA